MKGRLTSFLLAVVFVALTSSAMATTWYVNGVTGSDNNSCTSPTTPCKTIKHAISLSSPGDSIAIATATYTENLTIGWSLKILGSGASATIIDGGGGKTVVTIVNASADVLLSKVTIQHGSAVDGAGIYNKGMLTLANSTVSSNFANRGGGIFNLGTLAINKSTLSGNGTSAKTGFSFGGAIFSGGVVTINNSTISSNDAGGFLSRTFGGGIYIEGGTVTISNSTLSGNRASSLGVGGGIVNDFGSLTINNSTISGNSAINGGGIRDENGTLTINNSTVSGNSATFQGGGLSGGNPTLQNSIVANNSGGNCNGTVSSNGYNLSSDNNCNLNGPGDINNANPMLGPLQYNGGPTKTQALLAGSPAIDAGNPSGCTDGRGHLLKTDQRGVPRPDPEDTGGCDMGAYERQSD